MFFLFPSGSAGSSDAPDMAPQQAAVIAFALATGVLMFAGVAVGLPFFTDGAGIPEGAGGGEALPAEAAGGTSIVALLSIVHALTAIGGWALAFVIPTRLVDSARERGLPEPRNRSLLIRWALFEGVALFGIVIVLLAGFDDLLPEQPLYYANLVSTAMFLAVVAVDVPNLLSQRAAS